MAKTYDKDEVAEKVSKAEAKTAEKTTKTVTKAAVGSIQAQIDRVKASDLGKSEKKAAINALKEAASAVKAPI